MATYNGACALGIEGQFGSFEPGKKPGIMLLKGIEGDVVTAKTKVERLM
jgi:cytosine/adenosine deaminase-related metal-dependent hydrolase